MGLNVAAGWSRASRAYPTENRTGPVAPGPFAHSYPADDQLRSCGRLGGPPYRAVTGTWHVFCPPLAFSQSPTLAARQQNCSGSRGRAFVVGTTARFEVHES